MFEGFPALAALNNARERVCPRPAGGRHGGRPEVLRTIGLEEIQDRLSRYYKPRNATLALAGDFDPTAARKMIEAGFAAIPAGEAMPPPREPGAPTYLVPVRPKAGPADESEGQPTACLAYRAPRPGSADYAPFLVLVARLWAGGERPGWGLFGKLAGQLKVSRLWGGRERLEGSGPTGSPVFFTPLDDGSVVAVSATLKRGETPAQAFGRIETFVSETIEPKLGTGEATAAKEQLGFILGLADLPDAALGQNPYGVAFSLARRDQLGLDTARLGRSLEMVTDADLKRVAAEVFAPGRHAGAIAGLGEARP
jgi:zinc protease